MIETFIRVSLFCLIPPRTEADVSERQWVPLQRHLLSVGEMTLFIHYCACSHISFMGAGVTALGRSVWLDFVNFKNDAFV